MPSSGQKLELHLQVAVLLPDAIEAAPSAVADEEPAQAVCDRVVEELGRLVHLSRDLRDMVRERLELHLPAEPCSREIRNRNDESRHVLQSLVVQQPHVLEPIRLLDVADRLLDSPTRDVTLHDLPQGLARPHRIKRGQQHHRLLALGPFHDDKAKLRLRANRKPHRHRTVFDADVMNPVVRLVEDAVLVPQRALTRESFRQGHRILRLSAPIQQIPVACEANDEVITVVDVELEHVVAVPATVADEDAAPVRRRRDLADDLTDLVVLARVFRMYGRPEPEHQRNDPAASVLAGDRHAERVAEVVADLPLAAVPHLREIRHLLGVRLLNVGRIDDDQRVLMDRRRRVAEQTPVDLVVESVGLQMVLKPLLRLLRKDVFLKRTRDLADERVARGLDPEKNLPEELELRLWKPGRKYPQKFPQLLSRSERRCAIISHVVSSCRFSSRVL